MTTREELQKTIDGYIAASGAAEKSGDWAGCLGPFYADDAEYRWNVGPNEEFFARGREEIERLALGVQMEGFEGWSYPYERVLIDDQKGEVVAFWRQVAPISRADGSSFEVAGVGGSMFRYGGGGQWSHQRDFFDLGNVMALLIEVAGEGGLAPTVQKKLGRVMRGKKLPGHEPLRPKTSLVGKAKGALALGRILVGR